MKGLFIVCSAIVYYNGHKYTHGPKNLTNGGLCITGLRHCNCYETLSIIYPGHDYKSQSAEGFLTSDNTFVDRKTALDIAERRGQIRKKHGATNELYSEDLY